MNKEEILIKFYNLMKKYRIVHLTLSYLKFDGVNKLYNENLDEWINLTNEEGNTVNNYLKIPVDEFNRFYFNKIKENKISNKKLIT